MFDFPSPATDGQTVTGPNGQLYVYHAANGVWGASGSASPLAIAYGGTGATTAAAALTNLGAAPATGSPNYVAKAGDTMSGALTINTNGAAPPATTLGEQMNITGPNAAPALAVIDSFGGNDSYLVGRAARGTATAPTAVQSGDGLLSVVGWGRASSSAYGQFPNPIINFQANENWTATAQGSRLSFATAPTGGTSVVESLRLAGNAATFSGSVNIGNSLNLAGTTGGGPVVYGDQTNMTMQLGTGNGSFTFYDHPGNSRFVFDNAGNLTIQGATATKFSGTTWANPSSRDIKTDIADYDVGLPAIQKLKPRTFRFREDSGLPTNDSHIGLVHDETSHMPEMHRKATIGGGMDEPGREVDALDCSAVTWALVNAVKTLAAKVDALEKRVNGAAKKR